MNDDQLDIQTARTSGETSKREPVDKHFLLDLLDYLRNKYTSWQWDEKHDDEKDKKDS